MFMAGWYGPGKKLGITLAFPVHRIVSIEHVQLLIRRRTLLELVPILRTNLAC
jgi:hypothetical protein